MCEIEVLHKSASRVHACIAYDTKQQPFIVDLSSTHGEPLIGTVLKTPIPLKCRKTQAVMQYSKEKLMLCATETKMLRQATYGGAGPRRGIRVRRLGGEGHVAEGHAGPRPKKRSSASHNPSCCSRCERQTAPRQQRSLTRACALTGEEHAYFDGRHCARPTR